MSGGIVGGVTSAQITTALGYTPENVANKNVASGYAPLDAGTKLPLVNLNTITHSQVDSSIEQTANKGVANGYADLDASGLLPAARLSAGHIETGLGFTPENIANKGSASGYAGLDGSSHITAILASMTQLPSFPNDSTKFLQGDGTWQVLPIGMKFLARTKITGASSATVDVTGLTAFNYYMIFGKVYSSADGDGTIQPAIRFNGDAGANYNISRTVNGANVNASGAASIQFYSGNTSGELTFSCFIDNSIATKLKGCTGTCKGFGGSLVVVAGEWTNVLSLITEITLVSIAGTGKFDINSELVVFGFN